MLASPNGRSTARASAYGWRMALSCPSAIRFFVRTRYAVAILRQCLLIVIVAVAIATIADAQQSGKKQMHKLAFLSGNWKCTVKGGSSDGLVQYVQYSFSPDGLWLTEVSWDAGTRKDWASQLWGYDTRTQKLVAYQFNANGVFTKTVDGWINGAFRSTRDDNGATVSVRPTGARTAQWIIDSADHSYIVTENCVRRT